MRFKQIFLLLFLILFLPQAACAETELFKIKASAFPSKATLGDEIKLFILAETPLEFSIQPPLQETNLSPFEIKRIESKPRLEKNGRVSQIFILTLAAFQMGDLVVPQVLLTYKDASGQTGRVLTPSAKVKIMGVPKRPTDTDDIRAIKGPVSLDAGLLRSLILGLTAFLLFTGLCVKIILRRRRKKLEDLESLKPPHERARLELDRLLEKHFLEDKKIKEFYSELADILRRYLERRMKIEAFESTTVEILERLKRRGCDPVAARKIRDVLENSDLVKFAKFIPPRSLADTLAIELQSLIEMTTPKETAEEKGNKKQ